MWKSPPGSTFTTSPLHHFASRRPADNVTRSIKTKTLQALGHCEGSACHQTRREFTNGWAKLEALAREAADL